LLSGVLISQGRSKLSETKVLHIQEQLTPLRAHRPGKDYASPSHTGSGSTNNAGEASRKAPRQTKAKRSRRSCHSTGHGSGNAGGDFHPGCSPPGPVPTNSLGLPVPLQFLLSQFLTSASSSLVLTASICYVLISATLSSQDSFTPNFENKY